MTNTQKFGNMEQIDFKTAVEQLKGTGYPSEPDTVRIRISDAKTHLFDGIKYFTHEKAKWEASYEPIAEWLTDNHGKGLLLVGKCGLGKTLIGMRILPLLLTWYCKKVVSIYNAQQLNTSIDEALCKKLVYVDDIGTEDISNIYGNKRIPFAELCDAAEKQGKLLIVTTNLTPSQLAEKYGERTVDRLRGITKIVPFKGASKRE